MTDNLLTPREIRRYSQQIKLPGVGISGQARLKKASVLVVGAGGLGCPVLQYLAAAGTGNIAIAEYDSVDENNLQRQVLYGSEDMGKLKSIIAQKRLEQLNSLIRTEVINLRIDSSNALRIFRNYDIIVDATDNFPTRYLINDACVVLDKPMVHGAIYQHEAQVSVFNYMGGPTYRCYNPRQDRGSFMNPLPADVGLFGVLPGVAGAIMANEVIKIITGCGEVLSGKILVMDISGNNFTFLKVRSIPENHNITGLQKEY